MKPTNKTMLWGLSLVLVLAAPIFSQELMKIRVISESAQVRLKPDISSEIIRVAPVGAVLMVKERSGDWFYVDLPPTESGFVVSGFVHSNHVEIIAGEVPPLRDDTKKFNPPPRSMPEEAAAQAQYYPTYRTERGYGIRLLGGFSLGDATHSDVDTEDQDESDWKKYLFAPLGGLGFESGGRLGFEIDVFYHRKGIKYENVVDFEGDTADASLKVIVDEISVPVLLKIKLSPGSSPYFLGGGEIAYVLSAKADWEYSLSSGDSDAGSEDLKEYMKNIDYGLVFGAGLELALGGSSIFLEGRYYLGLQNLAEENEFVTADDWVRSRALVALLGIRF